jgi:DNA-directed RNA polymerase subunit alpha
MLVMPKVSVLAAAENYGRFGIEPLEAGHGTMLGNGLRRVLLSSIPGAAITKIKIEGVYHEFSTIPGVREDVTALILNLKGVRMRSFSERPVKLALTKIGQGTVHASDIDTPTTVEIVNPQHYLCALDSDVELAIDLTVERGRGASLADRREVQLPIGEIAIDAIFSPVVRVNYLIEPLDGPLGRERLVIEVWTDGTLKPGDALSHAGQMLGQYAQVVAAFGQPQPEAVPAGSSAPQIPAEVYDTPIDVLDLTTRTYNALKRADITRIGQILDKDEKALANIRNFGQKSVEELRDRLRERGYTDMPALVAEEGVS